MFPSFLFLFFLISSVYATGCGTGDFSDDEEDQILDIHNKLRSSIAQGTYMAKGTAKPKASNMQKMVWDCDLESSAQNFADTCPRAHSNTKGIGENLYWMWSTAPMKVDGKGVSASNAWQKEFQDKGWASNNLTYALFNTGIGHATQMAWAKTTKIGCGVKLCPSSYPAYQYEVAVVCQYSPQGNIINQNIYESGNTCSACGANSGCETSSGLCVVGGQQPVTVITTTSRTPTTIAQTTTPPFVTLPTEGPTKPECCQCCCNCCQNNN